MTKLTSSSKEKNPWDALFASVTRPIPPASNGNLSDGYTILIQHSITAASQRSHSLSSTQSNNNALSAMTNMTISKSNSSKSKGELFGMGGPFLVRRAFDELCSRCEGSVVFVSLLGNSGVIDLDALKEDSQFGDAWVGANHDDGLNAFSLFRQNGAVVDLASNPFGWDDETQDSSCGFITISSMINLQSIADAIRDAAAKVKSKNTTHQEKSNDAKKPIPIIFDSLTPLLAFHGAQNASRLLQSFKKGTSEQSALSPIVAPILYESITPSDHRILEDMADAFMTLQFRNEISKNDAIASGVLDLVRRGGGCLGGKLMRGVVAVNIVKATDDQKQIASSDPRVGCCWMIECEANHEEEKLKVKQNIAEAKANKEEGKEAQQKSRPRIYLEDNDPELIDFDEEDDIDDDLDL